jgi:hypothetical protein
MKYSILPMLFIFLALIMLREGQFVFADNTTDRILPIHEKEKQENRIKQAELIAEYGNQDFTNCYICSNQELANPFAQAACLRKATFCLEEKAIKPLWCPAGLADSAGTCVTADIGCKEQYGPHSYYTEGTKDGKYVCECAEGFGWNNDRSQCVQTACPDNYIYYSPYRTDTGEFLYGRCMTFNEACQSEYGEFSEFSLLTTNNDYYCRCQTGYDWNSEGNNCEKIIVKGYASPALNSFIYEETIAEEKRLASSPDLNLASRLKGRILLQVEKSGEAWYVNPNDQKKYFLSSPEQALTIMTKFGLGTTHEFLTSNPILPSQVLGKILIDTEDLGRAYYIYPVDQRAYYLGRPADAYTVIKNLGLGITNKDIRKITIGEID